MPWIIQSMLPWEGVWCVMGTFTDLQKAGEVYEEFMAVFPNRVWVISQQIL